MKIGIIGHGAIGQYVQAAAQERGHEVRAVLVRPSRLEQKRATHPDVQWVAKVSDLPDDIEHMVDCAGHQALVAHAPEVLGRGLDLTTVSLGALADQHLYSVLTAAAVQGGARLHLATGAIGALDCLRAASVGGLQRVMYTGRKPPRGWKGSPAEAVLNLEQLDEATTHFEGAASRAAIDYPKNANVAAAVALAGIGFDDTQVRLIADPRIDENIHQIEAVGAFGSFSFEIRGKSLPDNPRSSALAAMSVISKLEQVSQRIVI